LQRCKPFFLVWKPLCTGLRLRSLALALQDYSDYAPFELLEKT